MHGTLLGHMTFFLTFPNSGFPFLLLLSSKHLLFLHCTCLGGSFCCTTFPRHRWGSAHPSPFPCSFSMPASSPSAQHPLAPTSCHPSCLGGFLPTLSQVSHATPDWCVVPRLVSWREQGNLVSPAPTCTPAGTDLPAGSLPACLPAWMGWRNLLPAALL